MTRETRLDLANLAQKPGWTVDGLLEAAKGWIVVSKLCKQESFKMVIYMFLNRAMEIEAGLTISGR